MCNSQKPVSALGQWSTEPLNIPGPLRATICLQAARADALLHSGTAKLIGRMPQSGLLELGELVDMMSRVCTGVIGDCRLTIDMVAIVETCL